MWVAVALILLAACETEGGSVYEGMYTLEVHRERASCETGAWSDVPIPEPYFRLEYQKVGRQGFLGWKACDGPRSSSCPKSYALMGSFLQRDGLWESRTALVRYVDPLCEVEVTEGQLEETEQGVAWTLRSEGGALDVATEEDCVWDRVRDRTDALTCAGEIHYEAWRL